jgi:hypothetical protein
MNKRPDENNKEESLELGSYSFVLRQNDKKPRGFDTIYRRARYVFQKPQVRRRIKWAAVMLLLINIIGWSLFGYFLTKTNEVSATPTRNGKIIYSVNSTTPQYRNYTAASNTFGSAAAMQTSVAQTHMVTKSAPTRIEYISGHVDTSGNLYVQRWNGTAWSAEWNVATGGNGVDGRRFDIAYEKTTGNAMVVYSNNSAGASELRYNTWNGTSWSGATTLDSARLATIPTAIKLLAKPTGATNDIALTVEDMGTATANTSSLTTLIWNGSTWGNEPAAAHATAMYSLVTSGFVQNDCFDMAYESTSGDLLVAWTMSTPQQYYRTYSGTTWGTATSLATARATPLQMRLASNPNSDQVAIMFNRSASANVYGFMWDGATMSAVTTIGATGVNPTAIEKMHVTIKWLRIGTVDYAIAVWNSGTAGTFGYNYYTASAWGTASTYATGQTTTANWIESVVDPMGADTMMVTFSTGAATSGSLWAKRLVISGTVPPTFSWTNADGGTALTTTLASATSQNFSFDYNRGAPSVPTLYNDDGGSSQIAFNNIRQNSTTPLFRASATFGATFDTFQIEMNTNNTFSGTAYTQTFTGGSYSSALN